MPENNIFLYGFDKNLNRNVEVLLSPTVYDAIRESTSPQLLQYGGVLAGWTITPTTLTGNGNTSKCKIETHANSQRGIKLLSQDFGSLSSGLFEFWSDSGLTNYLYMKNSTRELVVDGPFRLEGAFICGSTEPREDNLTALGTATKRWSDLRSVLINGADIGFENGWKFREYPATKEDIGKPIEWMKVNANQGIQILDEEEKLIAVIHKNGNIYCNGIKPLSELM
mgnify:FL=1